MGTGAWDGSVVTRVCGQECRDRSTGIEAWSWEVGNGSMEMEAWR